VLGVADCRIVAHAMRMSDSIRAWLRFTVARADRGRSGWPQRTLSAVDTDGRVGFHAVRGG
jgi:hypothetical protein